MLNTEVRSAVSAEQNHLRPLAALMVHVDVDVVSV